jgi:hypothetical protein
MNENKNENISFFLSEKENTNDNEEQLLDLMNKINEDINEDINMDSTQNEYFLDNDYYLNNDELFYEEHTVKDLLKICNYYGIDKDIKSSKCKKQDIISTIIYFESMPENFEIVEKRNKMWMYMTEILNDVKMKKYIIWS